MLYTQTQLHFGRNKDFIKQKRENLPKISDVKFIDSYSTNIALHGINKERDSTGNSNFHSDPTNLN